MWVSTLQGAELKGHRIRKVGNLWVRWVIQFQISSKLSRPRQVCLLSPVWCVSTRQGLHRYSYVCCSGLPRSALITSNECSTSVLPLHLHLQCCLRSDSGHHFLLPILCSCSWQKRLLKGSLFFLPGFTSSSQVISQAGRSALLLEHRL